MRLSVRLRMSIFAAGGKRSQRCDDPQHIQRMRCRPQQHQSRYPLHSEYGLQDSHPISPPIVLNAMIKNSIIHNAYMCVAAV